MRNNWNWDWTQGPRGPRYGSRGRHHSPGGALLGIFGLLVGFRVIVSVLALAAVVLGAVFSGLAAGLSGVLSGIGSVFSEIFADSDQVAGLAVGTMIGLLAYYRIRQKKTRATGEEKKAEQETESQENYEEPQTYRNYYA